MGERVKRPDGVTLKATMACAHWLTYCLSIGWPRSILDRLEQLWWDHHDRYGRLIAASRTKASGGPARAAKEAGR